MIRTSQFKMRAAFAFALLTLAAFANHSAADRQRKLPLSKPVGDSLFDRVVKNSGLKDELWSLRSFTLFAPSDRAMRRLSPVQLRRLLSRRYRAEAAWFVRSHVIPHKITHANARRFHRLSLPTLVAEQLRPQASKPSRPRPTDGDGRPANPIDPMTGTGPFAPWYKSGRQDDRSSFRRIRDPRNVRLQARGGRAQANTGGAGGPGGSGGQGGDSQGSGSGGGGNGGGGGKGGDGGHTINLGGVFNFVVVIKCECDARTGALKLQVGLRTVRTIGDPRRWGPGSRFAIDRVLPPPPPRPRVSAPR